MTTKMREMLRQGISSETLAQGHALFYAFSRANAAGHLQPKRSYEELVEMSATTLADFLGYAPGGSRFYFEVNVMTSIRNRFRDELRRNKVEV